LPVGGFRQYPPIGTLFAELFAVKAKTLYYCPHDENELLFEEIFDECQDFAYQPLHELPQLCPKCGRVLFKKDCITVEELYKIENRSNVPDLGPMGMNK
jgi:hypothetical protein